MVGDLLENTVVAAIDALLPDIPVLKDLVMAVLGSLVDFVRWVLDLGDDIEEWLSDLFSVSFGLFDIIVTAIGNFLADDYPLHKIDDQFEMIPVEGNLPAVLVPIDDLNARIDSNELTLTATIGA